MSMFKSAATKIAHNTTIPALAGNSDLRPLQDLITAEKTVLTSLQRLRVDLAKAGDALRVWGQGEGDDLADILAASSTILACFATALSTYSSLHHTVRDSMKSVRTREEALEEIRRRRRRTGASAEAAEKKLNKMSPEHKNLTIQTDILNRLREDMRVLDAEILREEADLADYKRKCTKDWMGFKFGGLVECCEKGVIAGDIGRQIIQSIPEDTTQPGAPRAYYSAHGHVGDLVVEAQRAVSQVVFSAKPVGRTSSEPISQSLTAQEPHAESHFLPTPSLGSQLTLGISTYNLPPGPVPVNRRVSVDELGVQTLSAQAAPQFPSLPANREHDHPVAVTPSVSPGKSLSPAVPYDSGVARSDENQSLMASIADALSYSHRGFNLEDSPSADEPVPKYEPYAKNVTSAQSEPHAPVTNGHVSEEREAQGPRRTMRRSTSPPSLPPGAAPAAIRAWDDRAGQGEDGAHSDRPASSSACVTSQPVISSSEQDGEEVHDSAFEHENQSLKEGQEVGGDGEHHEEDTSFPGGSGNAAADANAANDQQDTMPIQRSLSTTSTRLLSRAGSQWRIPRVPPPPMDPNVINASGVALDRRSIHDTAVVPQDDGTRTDELVDDRARNEAAAREVSRAMDALEFSAVAPSSAEWSGYATPRGPSPGYAPALSMQPQATAPHLRVSPQLPPSSSTTPYSSVPSSPATLPTPPFASRGHGSVSPIMDARPLPGHHLTSNDSPPERLPAPTTAAGTPTLPGSMSPKYHSPPPDYPRPTPPFSSSFMARSTSSLNGGGTSPVAGPRTISAAAFRRQHVRSPSGSESGPADTRPLMLRRPSGSSSSIPPTLVVGAPKPPPKARLSVTNPDPQGSDGDEERGDEEFDYIGAYSRDSTGYGAGRYVSDLERS